MTLTALTVMIWPQRRRWHNLDEVEFWPQMCKCLQLCCQLPVLNMTLISECSIPIMALKWQQCPHLVPSMHLYSIGFFSCASMKWLMGTVHLVKDTGLLSPFGTLDPSKWMTQWWVMYSLLCHPPNLPWHVQLTSLSLSPVYSCTFVLSLKRKHRVQKVWCIPEPSQLGDN
jgi:hypothetical protein